MKILADDLITKADWYRSIGVPEYWIIAPKNRILERMVQAETGWLREGFDETGILRPGTFPGLEIPIGRLLDRPKRVR